MKITYHKAAGPNDLELIVDPEELQQLLNELTGNGFAFVVDDYKVTVFYQGEAGLRKLIDVCSNERFELKMKL